MKPDGIFEIQAGICRTLSNPIRLQMIHVLRNGPMCVSDITRAMGQSESMVSRNLGTLRNNHLVTAERQAQEIIYSIANPKITTICNLMREVLIDEASHQSQLVLGFLNEDSEGPA